MASKFYDRSYAQKPELELIKLSKLGDKCAESILIKRYTYLVYSKSRAYFLKGGDREDLIQEGLIGLCQAIKRFDLRKHESFEYFAGLCIKRKLISAVKKYGRQKHSPLNDSKSLNKKINNDKKSYEFLDFLEANSDYKPLEAVITKESQACFEKILKDSLSKFEYRVFSLYLEGYTYEEIGSEIDRDIKSVDNALYRSKFKLKQAFFNFF